MPTANNPYGVGEIVRKAYIYAAHIPRNTSGRSEATMPRKMFSDGSSALCPVCCKHTLPCADHPEAKSDDSIVRKSSKAASKPRKPAGKATVIGPLKVRTIPEVAQEVIARVERSIPAVVEGVAAATAATVRALVQSGRLRRR